MPRPPRPRFFFAIVHQKRDGFALAITIAANINAQTTRDGWGVIPKD